ncbi:hypothetical protein B7494_g7118 [Chlorociboria aeruginascens]|nr:hypothetical protein B7494_g7118 [Chlorociboria aeruginascens]
MAQKSSFGEVQTLPLLLIPKVPLALSKDIAKPAAPKQSDPIKAWKPDGKTFDSSIKPLTQHILGQLRGKDTYQEKVDKFLQDQDNCVAWLILYNALDSKEQDSAEARVKLSPPELGMDAVEVRGYRDPEKKLLLCYKPTICYTEFLALDLRVKDQESFRYDNYFAIKRREILDLPISIFDSDNDSSNDDFDDSDSDNKATVKQRINTDADNKIIIACDEYRYQLCENNIPKSYYSLQGQNIWAGDILFLDTYENPKGSPMSTALAAGFSALILTYDRLANPGRPLAKKERHTQVEHFLNQMKSDTENSNFVIFEKFGAINKSRVPPVSLPRISWTSSANLVTV